MSEIVVNISSAGPEIVVNMENATPEIIVDIIATGPAGPSGSDAEGLSNIEIETIINSFV